jgi:hypothetical protein
MQSLIFLHHQQIQIVYIDCLRKTNNKRNWIVDDSCVVNSENPNSEKIQIEGRKIYLVPDTRGKMI